MELEYGHLSEERNEEIKRMEIVNPYGEDCVPRINFEGINVVKTKDERFILKRIYGNREYYDEHPGKEYFLFIIRETYRFIIIPTCDYTVERINKTPLIDHVTIRIKKVEGLSDEESSVLVLAFRVEKRNRYRKGDIVKCRIYYDNQLKIKEF